MEIEKTWEDSDSKQEQIPCFLTRRLFCGVESTREVPRTQKGGVELVMDAREVRFGYAAKAQPEQAVAEWRW